MKATRRVLDARDSTPTIRTNLPYMPPLGRLHPAVGHQQLIQQQPRAGWIVLLSSLPEGLERRIPHTGVEPTGANDARPLPGPQRTLLRIFNQGPARLESRDLRVELLDQRSPVHVACVDAHDPTALGAELASAGSAVACAAVSGAVGSGSGSPCQRANNPRWPSPCFGSLNTSSRHCR